MLPTNNASHNWFLCDERYKSVSVLSEKECNELIADTLYEAFIDEGVIDEDYDFDKFCEDYEENLIEAKFGMTEERDGLKTGHGNIIIRKSSYIGELPFGYSVDEDGDLLNRHGNVIGHVKNEP